MSECDCKGVAAHILSGLTNLTETYYSGHIVHVDHSKDPISHFITCAFLGFRSIILTWKKRIGGI